MYVALFSDSRTIWLKQNKQELLCGFSHFLFCSVNSTQIIDSDEIARANQISPSFSTYKMKLDAHFHLMKSFREEEKKTSRLNTLLMERWSFGGSMNTIFKRKKWNCIMKILRRKNIFCILCSKNVVCSNVTTSKVYNSNKIRLTNSLKLFIESKISLYTNGNGAWKKVNWILRLSIILNLWLLLVFSHLQPTGTQENLYKNFARYKNDEHQK